MNLKRYARGLARKGFSFGGKVRNRFRIARYIVGGRAPWSPGYAEYRADAINKSINNSATLDYFGLGLVPEGYGVGLDERIVEYPWMLAHLCDGPTKLLDAGSTLNYIEILSHRKVAKKDVYIQTYQPEAINYNKRRVSYIYGDLRFTPFSSDFFDEVACISTLEHIDMDNSIYGYEMSHTNKGKSYEFLKVVDELTRVTKPGGTLLISVPFGHFENFGFFQQFDDGMLSALEDRLSLVGRHSCTFFKYESTGWQAATRSELDNIRAYNPHTGAGRGEDGAAHTRSIVCVKFSKNFQ